MTPTPEKPRPWMCPNGHLNGHVERDEHGYRLVIYEQAIDPHWPSKDHSPIYRSETRGLAVVRCTICRADKEWYPNKELLDRLLNRARKSKKEIKPAPMACGLTQRPDAG